MSTTFDDRENVFETKFAQDEAALFRAEARAVKLFGLWLAEKLGLTGEAAMHYAADLVIANLDTPGLDDVVDKAEADLKVKNVTLSRLFLTETLNTFFSQAKAQMVAEGK